MKSSSVRVVAAMSGGVDSSVTALLLLEMGYEVIGMTMQIQPPSGGEDHAQGLPGCCSLSAVEDARRVAGLLGIPHYVVNLRREFAAEVIADFCCEYERGRTPNPCIRCNESIKFGSLWQRAREIDAAFLATGHYARLEYDRDSSRHVLRRGIDTGKDQSYFLYSMSQKQISRTLMPLGNMTKERVRELAAAAGLPTAAKRESQEICFIPDDDYAAFLAARNPEALLPGDIVDLGGRVLGRHEGIVHYTVGQRRGLGIAWSEPLYVLALDPAANRVVVGPERELFRNRLTASKINWVALPGLRESRPAEVVFRYRMRPAPALLEPAACDRVNVIFRQPQRAIAPGQAAVFYDGDTVLGGGLIESSA